MKRGDKEDDVLRREFGCVESGEEVEVMTMIHFIFRGSIEDKSSSFPPSFSFIIFIMLGEEFEILLTIFQPLNY